MCDDHHLHLRLKEEHCVRFTFGQTLMVKPLKQQCGEDEKHTSVCASEVDVTKILGLNISVVRVGYFQRRM